MSLFLHKHWKKAVLALTAAFWASCDSDAVSANSSDSDEKTEISSSSKSKDESSSSAETPATKPTKVSSSSEEAKSSNSAEAPATKPAKVSSSSEEAKSSSSAEAPATKPAKVSSSSEEAKFSSSAEAPATKPAKVSSSSKEAKSSSSAKWHRRSSSSRFIPMHPIDEDSPLYGVVDTIIETPIAMYGPPCYFSGTCDEEGQDTLTPIKDSIGDAIALYGVYMPDSLLSEKMDLDPSEKSRKDLKGRRQ